MGHKVNINLFFELRHLKIFSLIPLKSGLRQLPGLNQIIRQLIKNMNKTGSIGTCFEN